MDLLRDYWIVIAIAGAVVAAALAFLAWLWWKVPKWQMQNRIFKSEKERADAEDNFRKTVGQALGGAAVLFGAVLAYLQFSQQQKTASQQFLEQQDTLSKQIAAQQKAAADQVAAQLQASEVSRKVAEDLRISNQVAKGFEQLANKESVTMRLGGIYGLEGVMNSSQQYHQPVLEALCAFVREGSTEKKTATDVQAALTVIGRRTAGPGEVALALANMTGADLTNANLSDADLRDADLSYADLSYADLRAAHLSSTDLSGANLRGANLRGANLTSANLSSAHLSGADLRGAHLSGVDLSGALLSPSLGGALLHSSLRGAFLLGADLTGAHLVGANLRGANLSGGTRLGGVDLFNANLSDADLRGAQNLIQAQLDQACGEPPKLEAGSVLRWDSARPCPEKPVASPLNPRTTP